MSIILVSILMEVQLWQSFIVVMRNCANLIKDIKGINLSVLLFILLQQEDKIFKNSSFTSVTKDSSQRGPITLPVSTQNLQKIWCFFLL